MKILQPTLSKVKICYDEATPMADPFWRGLLFLDEKRLLNKDLTNAIGKRTTII